MHPDSYTVSDYLLDRLAQLGADRIFGVPGDYTLQLLDHVIEHNELAWVGCTNELNAGYAADGYARMRGIAALMTTFGVGELSAINAIAGSFAEHVAVVHVVGAPSTGTQAAARIVHHSLGDGVFTQFMQMHDKITCARAALTPANACAEIDRVLAAVRDHRLPGYLLLPADVGEVPTQAPSGPLPAPTRVTDASALAAFRRAAAGLLATTRTADDIRVLGGLLVHRLDATNQLQRLLTSGPLQHATSLWGKSLVDESDPGYLGIYAGAASDPLVRGAIEQAPVLVVAGVQFTDLNSGFFTHQLDRERTIELGASSASVAWARFDNVSLPDTLSALADLIEQDVVRATAGPTAPATPANPAPERDGGLTQDQLWSTVSSRLRSGDIVVADQGTSFYGVGTRRLPSGVTFLGQPLWASIGYTLPSLLGACLSDPSRRGVLLIGDGAGQLTVQELSTIIRQRLHAVIVVVDNDGYTVERAIHGPDQPYNDIAPWDWTKLPAAFAPGVEVDAHRVTTVAELEAAWPDGDQGSGITVIQAVVPRMDVPELLVAVANAASAANAK
jgi:TPP-dependent 2-oxoacid decarboxylase